MVHVTLCSSCKHFQQKVCACVHSEMSGVDSNSNRVLTSPIRGSLMWTGRLFKAIHITFGIIFLHSLCNICARDSSTDAHAELQPYCHTFPQSCFLNADSLQNGYAKTNSVPANVAIKNNHAQHTVSFLLTEVKPYSVEQYGSVVLWVWVSWFYHLLSWFYHLGCTDRSVVDWNLLFFLLQNMVIGDRQVYFLILADRYSGFMM